MDVLRVVLLVDIIWMLSMFVDSVLADHVLEEPYCKKLKKLVQQVSYAKTYLHNKSYAYLLN